MPHLMDFKQFTLLTKEQAGKIIRDNDNSITLNGDEFKTDLADLFKVIPIETVKAAVIDIAEWVPKEECFFYVTTICEAGEVVVMADWSVWSFDSFHNFAISVLEPLSEIKKNVSFKGMYWGDLKNDKEMLERISNAAFEQIPGQFSKEDDLSREEVIEKVLENTNLQ